MLASFRDCSLLSPFPSQLSCMGTATDSAPSLLCIRSGWEFGVQAIGSALSPLVWGIQGPPGPGYLLVPTKGDGGQAAGEQEKTQPWCWWERYPCSSMHPYTVHSQQGHGVANLVQDHVPTSKLGYGRHGLFSPCKAVLAALCVPCCRGGHRQPVGKAPPPALGALCSSSKGRKMLLWLNKLVIAARSALSEPKVGLGEQQEGAPEPSHRRAPPHVES